MSLWVCRTCKRLTGWDARFVFARTAVELCLSPTFTTEERRAKMSQGHRDFWLDCLP